VADSPLFSYKLVAAVSKYSNQYTKENAYSMIKKREVYFNDFNILMENAAYLPLVSGLLRAYAKTFESITDNYQFMPFLLHRDSLDTIVAQYQNPNVAALPEFDSQIDRLLEGRGRGCELPEFGDIY